MNKKEELLRIRGAFNRWLHKLIGVRDVTNKKCAYIYDARFVRKPVKLIRNSVVRGKR